MPKQGVKNIGILVGREWSWPPAFLEEVNNRDAGAHAEFATLGGTRMNEPCPYDVLVDRISHEIPYYRTYLKNAALQGTVVVNNPFWWSADDKFFGACLADKLGIAHPRTIALPSHSYVEGIVHTESLRNLAYPVPWQEHLDYVGGFPVILKPAWGGGFKSVYKVDNLDELWSAYNQTGIECMMLQQYIAWEKYARCLVINKTNILVMKFDATAPWPHRYFVDHSFLTSEEGTLVVDGARRLCEALGYDMNTVEFAIKDGIPYAIDFTNPAPDMDVNSLTPHYFEWAVREMANMCIDLALGKREQSRPVYRWDALMNGTGASTDAELAPAAAGSSQKTTEGSSTGPAIQVEGTTTAR